MTQRISRRTRHVRPRRGLRPGAEACESRRLLSVQYHGGPLLTSVSIETVYYGQSWGNSPPLTQEAAWLDDALGALASGPFLSQLTQYNTNGYTIGSGSVLGHDFVTGATSPASGTTVDDTQIQAMLSNEIAAGRLQPPTPSRLLFVYTAPNIVVTLDGQNSQKDFSGYHSSFNDKVGTEVSYAVIPNPTGNGVVNNLSAFQTQTEVSSHELAEAATDPYSNPGWFDDVTGNEIGDFNVAQDAFLDDDAIQALYSNLTNGPILPASATPSPVNDLSATGQNLLVGSGGVASGVVATFTDGDATTAAIDYTATITWGDGTTSTGTIAPDPAHAGVYDVSGTHTYTGAGPSFTITTAISDFGANPTATRSTATFPSLTINATGLAIAATEGALFSGIVATFTDGGVSNPVGAFTATITWGDGTTTSGQISLDPKGGYDVLGSHAYTEEGSVALGIVIQSGGGVAQATGSAVITDPPVVPQGGFTLKAVEGLTLAGAVVATFTDPGGVEALTDYSALINWGDGSTSIGVLSLNGAVVSVAGSHVYAEEGTNPVVVTTGHDQAPSVLQATSSVVVADAALTANGRALSLFVGSAYSGPVATFTDADPAGTVADYSATIAWGDGTTAMGTIVALASGGFEVDGAHTYVQAGAGLAVTVTIADKGGAQAVATGSATATLATLTASGLLVRATEGMSVSATVATFTDSQPNAAPGGFTATIDWGDGTQSAGTVIANPNGAGFAINGTHTYTSATANAKANATVSDPWGATATTAGAVVVQDLPLTAAGLTLSALPNVARSGTVATFLDPDPNASHVAYTVTIAWGDGQTSAGTVVAAKGTLAVTGSHTYASSGSYSIAVAIQDPGGASAAAHGTAVVASQSPVDFAGKGSSTVGVFRPATAQWIAPGLSEPAFGASNLADIPVPGDYDGVGHTELAVFRPATAQWIIQNPNGSQRVVSFGASNLFDIPVPGDYDGVGHTEIAVFRPSTAQWIILNPDGSQRVVSFGASNLFDIPVPGDYDGVGRTEIAVYRPSTAQWIILNPNGSQRVVSFGASNLFDIPVPGDYDGAGRDQLAVFRPSSAHWFVMNPDGSQTDIFFGAVNLADLPLEAPVGSLAALGLGMSPALTAHSVGVTAGLSTGPTLSDLAAGSLPILTRPKPNPAWDAALAAWDASP